MSVGHALPVIHSSSGTSPEDHHTQLVFAQSNHCAQELSPSDNNCALHCMTCFSLLPTIEVTVNQHHPQITATPFTVYWTPNEFLPELRPPRSHQR
ncbi:hypothetical protein [Zophobihabitans entericus]|uniref:Uncharacterized protein n=1 Tax=Zophobihabitans entericus TaxID=1635327 RepID=A0A6G9I7P9_9GAMM|nr:hypothetical protein [Zophobihabitans entericus]QIQ20231.1 hypothetical protein IPMB12_00165 [Zophobihabitans entericus]